jgi:CheY-like chemotaxis protein
LCETSDQRLIVGTLSSGVWMINQKKEVHQLLKDCSTVSSIFEDLNRNIWIGTWKQGLFRINPNGEIRNYQYNPANKQGISSDFVRAICQDNQGTLWIGTRKGLDHLNLSTDEFVHYNSGIGVTGVLTNESIWSLYKDQQGTLWIGTYFGGVNYFNPSMNFYTLHDLRNGSFLNKPFHVIGKILEDLEGRIILGTEGNGLIIYNRNNKTYQNIPGNTPGGISSENIKSFYYDKATDKLWIGTHLGGLTLVNLKNLTTTQYKTVWPDWSESDIIRSIIPYENDLLIATHNGLFRFNINNGGFSIFSDKIHKQVKFFNSIKIRDGQEGLEMTIEHQPDIVLSDLMMPRLSGAEMCSKIKNNFAVSHIPVVLLTAQTAIEYNIEGLKLGADDYITKPFNVKALITRCNNLVNNRRMLQEKYSRQIDFSPLMLATNKIDSDFMQKAHQVVEKHMDNADFDVKLFSEELGLSRTCLFTKLKGVTGQTPNDFIMNVRLKKAAELL